MQLLIIGASGFIGRHLFQYCKENNIHVAGTYYKHKMDENYIFFDMYHDTFYELLERLPKSLHSEELAVILCSADASIDSCKMHEELSYQLNVEKTKELLLQLEELDIKTVFLSSEAVFDGERGLYTEEDAPNPITVYGKQKYEIEKFISDRLKKVLVFRISRAVGSCFGEKDIFDEFYKKIHRNEKIICLKNQSFCVTEMGDISKAIVSAIDKDLQGIYHISSDNYTTRSALAKRFSEMIFNGKGLIEEKDFEEMEFADKRHIKGGLNGKKLEKDIGMEYMDLETIIKKYKGTIPENRNEEVERNM